MPVPDFQSLMLPVLTAVAAEQTASPDLRRKVSESLNLGETDLAEMLPSGRQTTFSNRVAWANVFLQRAGLIEKISRGTYRATDLGRSLLNESPAKIDMRLLARYPSFVDWRRRGAVGNKFRINR